MRSLVICTNVIGMIKLRRMSWAGMRLVQERGEVYTEFWWGNLRERNHWEEPGVGGKQY
jgi:hypothetical protein